MWLGKSEFTCSHEVAVQWMGVEMFTNRIGRSYKSLSNNLAPEKTFGARNPMMCPSVWKKNIVLFVSVKGT